MMRCSTQKQQCYCERLEKTEGTLTGRTLEVFADRPMCATCRKVLPKLGLELGNPTVTFVDDTGLRLTMRNGQWDK